MRHSIYLYSNIDLEGILDYLSTLRLMSGEWTQANFLKLFSKCCEVDYYQET